MSSFSTSILSLYFTTILFKKSIFFIKCSSYFCNISLILLSSSRTIICSSGTLTFSKFLFENNILSSSLFSLVIDIKVGFFSCFCFNSPIISDEASEPFCISFIFSPIPSKSSNCFLYFLSLICLITALTLMYFSVSPFSIFILDSDMYSIMAFILSFFFVFNSYSLLFILKYSFIISLYTALKFA